MFLPAAFIPDSLQKSKPVWETSAGCIAKIVFHIHIVLWGSIGVMGIQINLLEKKRC